MAPMIWFGLSYSPCSVERAGLILGTQSMHARMVCLLPFIASETAGCACSCECRGTLRDGGLDHILIVWRMKEDAITGFTSQAG